MNYLPHFVIARNSHRKCSIEKGVLENFSKFTGKHLCQVLASNFIKKETLEQLFSTELSQINKTTFFIEHPLVTASE